MLNIRSTRAERQDETTPTAILRVSAFVSRLPPRTDSNAAVILAAAARVTGSRSAMKVCIISQPRSIACGQASDHQGSAFHLGQAMSESNTSCLGLFEVVWSGLVRPRTLVPRCHAADCFQHSSIRQSPLKRKDTALEPKNSCAFIKKKKSLFGVVRSSLSHPSHTNPYF